MNWAGSLGVSPQLLRLDLVRPLVGLGPMPVLIAPTRAAVPKAPRLLRTRAQSRALRARVLAALARHEDRVAIALRERVTPSYVDLVAREHGQGAQRKRSEDLQQIVVAARQLKAAQPALKQKEIAALCGVSPPYLCNLFNRFPQ
jgi:AraC-like DNA-binding protein